MLINFKFFNEYLLRRKIAVPMVMSLFLFTCWQIYKRLPNEENTEAIRNENDNSQLRNVRVVQNLDKDEMIYNDGFELITSQIKQLQTQQIIRRYGTAVHTLNSSTTDDVNSKSKYTAPGREIKYLNDINNVDFNNRTVNIYKQYSHKDKEDNQTEKSRVLEADHSLHISQRSKDLNSDYGLFNGNVTNQEQHNLVFLKVHKAASTTVHNMVMRFALTRNLDVMLPRSANILSESGYLIKPTSLHPYPPDLKFNIICNHIIFNKGEISKFLKNPKSTFYIGIVREPFGQFTSAFYYYLNTFKRLTLVNIALDNPKHPIRGFLENPLKHVDARSYAMSVSFINNRMSADFGFPMWNLETDKHNEKLIERFLIRVQETFHLVMVVELFDESIVLLRRLLHWSMKDVIYMRTNKMDYSNQEQMQHLPWKVNLNFTDEDRQLHQKYAPVDHALYNHFLDKLMQMIKEQPDNFMEEVQMFKKVLHNVTSFCQNNEYSDNIAHELIVTSNRWTAEFKVSPHDCVLIQMNERDLVGRTRDQQMLRYNKKV